MEQRVHAAASNTAHAEISRLTKLLPALKSPEDDAHIEAVKARITALKREATAAKPLEDQIKILQNLVKRKTQTLDNLVIFINDAQKEHQVAGAELNQINADLAILKQRRLVELDIQPVQVANPQAQAHILQQDQVIAQMAQQLNQLQTLLLSVQAAQVPLPGAPSVDGMQAAPPTPFAPGPLPGAPASPVAPVLSPVHAVALVDVYSSEPLSQPSTPTKEEIARAAALEEIRKDNRERTPRGTARETVSSDSSADNTIQRDLTRHQITDPLFR